MAGLLLVAFAVMTSLAVGLFAPTALLAIIAAVLDRGMAGGRLLTDDWQTCRTAARHVDGTTGGRTTSTQHQASSHVVIAIPIINPGLGMGAMAVEGQGGGLQEILYVNVGQMHSETATDGIGVATWDSRVHQDKIALLDWAQLHRAGRRTINGINAQSTISSSIGRLDWNDANVMPSGQQIEIAM